MDRPSVTKKRSTKESKERAAEIDFEERISISFRSFTEASKESERAAASSGSKARVEILQDKEVVFTDDVPLPVDEDGAYREYVVAVKESPGREANSEFAYKQAADRKVTKTATAKKPAKKKGATSRTSKK